MATTLTAAGSKRARRRLVVPALRKTPRETLLSARPFFLRGGEAPTTAPPPLLSFDGPGFLDDFLQVVADPARLPPLLPWRDWAEPPQGVLDAAGQPRYPAVVSRAQPIAIEPDAGPGLDPDGVPTAVPAGAPPWLRKLYLPLHTHFTLVAFDVVCEALGWPRLTRSRVLAAGAVVRRIRLDRTALRYEDWISVDGKRGIWLELGVPLQASLDPEALPTAAFAGQEVVVRARLGLGATAPLPTALASAKLALLPPDAADGEAGRHCTLFGYVPVFTAAEQATDLAETAPADLVLALQARVATTVAGLAQTAPSLATRITFELRTLIDRTVRPDFVAGRLDAAWNDIGNFVAGGLVGSRAQAEAALELVTRLILEQGVRTLAPVTRDADAIGTAAAPVQTTRQWLASAQTALVAFAQTAAGRTAFGSDWLASTYVNRTASWRLILHNRIRQGLDVLRGATPATAPAPAPALPGPSRDLVLAAMLLRLRLYRLSLVASLRRQMFGPAAEIQSLLRTRDPLPPGTPIPTATVGGLAGEIRAALALEETRSTDQPPPWPPVSDAVPPGSGNRTAVLAHTAAHALEDLYADFEAEAARVGSAFEEVQDARLQERAAAIAAAARVAGTSAARVRWVRSFGLEVREQPARGLLGIPGTSPTAANLQTLTAPLQARYSSQATALGIARAEARVPRLRFDADNLYAIQCWVRVAGRDACELPQVIWTPPSEVFSLAEPSDILGAKPATVQLPDIDKLLRDIPRIAKAKARPFAAFAAPPNSSYVTGEEPGDTERAWGIGWICSFAIPVLTICAYILFSIIFAILILLPSFAWMLLLKICIPVPKRSP